MECDEGPVGMLEVVGRVPVHRRVLALDDLYPTGRDFLGIKIGLTGQGPREGPWYKIGEIEKCDLIAAKFRPGGGEGCTSADKKTLSRRLEAPAGSLV